jgi:ATP synthase F1 delta subunit
MIRSLRNKQLARNYARAFFRVYDLSQKTLFSSITALEDFFVAHKIVFHTLLLSSARVEDKIDALEKVVKKLKLVTSMHQLLEILIRHKTLHILPFLLPALKEVYKKKYDIHDVTVTSAQPLSAVEQKQLEKEFCSKLPGTLHFIYEHDESLIAGMKIQTPTHCWEESIARTMRTLQNRLRLQENI